MPGRPVSGVLLACDGAPRERGAAQAELAGPLGRPGQRAVPPAQLVRGGVRGGVGEHREHVGLGVPERVPVVAVAGQPLGRNRPALGPRPGLQHMEQAEPDRLLDLVVAVQFHVGPAPEVVQVTTLLGAQRVPAGLGRDQQRPLDLVAQRGPGPDRGPAVADELDQVELLALVEPAADGQPGQVRQGLAGLVQLRVGDHPVLHGGAHGQVAVPGPVHQPGPLLGGAVLECFQRSLQHGRDPGIAADRGQLLVGHQLGLEHDPDRAVQ